MVPLQVVVPPLVRLLIGEVGKRRQTGPHLREDAVLGVSRRHFQQRDRRCAETRLPDNDISFRVFDEHVSLQAIIIRPVRALGLRAADARILCEEAAVKLKQLIRHNKQEETKAPGTTMMTYRWS